MSINNQTTHADSAGTQFWFDDGVLHRLDGPAVIFIDGDQLFYIQGNLLDKTQWLHETKLIKIQQNLNNMLS